MATDKREPFHWRTSIAYKTQPKIVIRGYDLNELVGNLDLAEMAYLVWRGELPSEAHGRMLNAIMVCLAEHAFSPSAASARFIASGGVPLHVGVAGGMLTIGDIHGTFDRPCAMFRDGVTRAKAEGKTLEEMADILVREAKEKKKRLLIITKHEKRRFPAHCDYITSPGYLFGPEGRIKAGLKVTTPPITIVTDLTVMEITQESRTMRIVKLMPGVPLDKVLDTLQFAPAVSPHLIEVEPPTLEQVRVLREEVDPMRVYLKADGPSGD